MANPYNDAHGKREFPDVLHKRIEQWTLAGQVWGVIDWLAKIAGIVGAALAPILRHRYPVVADGCAITAAIATATLTVLKPERTAGLFWSAARIGDAARRKFAFENGTIEEVNAAITEGEQVLEAWFGAGKFRRRRQRGSRSGSSSC